MVQQILNMDLEDKVKRYIIENRLLKKGDCLIIGVSGGPDSVTLARILKSIQYELGISFRLAHYNHKLRSGADRDERFVKQLARELNVPCHCASWNKRTAAKGSSEEDARKKRLKFLADLARKTDAQAVALAHNKDDLAETVLMRLIRGSGMKGVRAILPLRMLNGVNFIRPLLATPRKDIELFLRTHKYPFCTDPTNRHLRFFRNKIRLKLLPLLEKEYNSNIRSALCNYSQTASADYAYIKKRTDKMFSKLAKIDRDRREVRFDLKRFGKVNIAIRRRLIRKAVSVLKGNTNRLDLVHIKEAEDLIRNRPQNSIIHFPDKIKITKNKNNILVYK